MNNEEYIASDGSVLESGMEVLVRNYDHKKWNISKFGYIDEEFSDIEYKKFKCINGIGFRYCIPFKNNEYLLGTTDNFINKVEFKFGDKVYVKNKEGDTELFGVFNRYIENSYCPYEVFIKDSNICTDWKYCRLANDND